MTQPAGDTAGVRTYLHQHHERIESALTEAANKCFRVMPADPIAFIANEIGVLAASPLPNAASVASLQKQLSELTSATLRLCNALPKSVAWADERRAIAELLGQRNTYCTWSLTLVADRDKPVLYGDGSGAAN